ncbi:hypothetical protein [Rubrivirga sp. IMCC45206]|uniref:hypothetical protein n=1 Tax=Rubrivirga sp. IMCC45206 TaxID=3391614 RepID=UPI00398FF498
MQFLLDHLISVVVAGILILILQVGQIRTQHADIEQVTSHSVKAKTLIFGRWVEDDIMNIGANFGTNLYRFEAPTLEALTGNALRWEFYSDSTQDDGTKSRIFKRYRLVENGVAQFEQPEATFRMYRVERDSVVVDYSPTGSAPTLGGLAESAWVRSGNSIETVSFFKIELLDRFGETPLTASGDVDVLKADYIRVRFGVVPEYVLSTDGDSRGNTLRELYWSKTLKVRPYWVPPPSQS